MNDTALLSCFGLIFMVLEMSLGPPTVKQTTNNKENDLLMRQFRLNNMKKTQY